MTSAVKRSAPRANPKSSLAGGRYFGCDPLGAAGGVAAAAREQREALGMQVAFIGQTRHAAYAVAAHLGLRAVGVEHPHGVESVGEHHVQHSVAPSRLLAGAQVAGESAQIAGCSGTFGREVYHHELVARAVAFYDFRKHLRGNNVSLPKYRSKIRIFHPPRKYIFVRRSFRVTLRTKYGPRALALPNFC